MLFPLKAPLTNSTEANQNVTLKPLPETQTGNLSLRNLLQTRKGGTPNFWFPKMNAASRVPLLQSTELSAQQQERPEGGARHTASPFAGRASKNTPSLPSKFALFCPASQNPELRT